MRDLLHKGKINGRYSIFNNNPEYADIDIAVIISRAGNQYGSRSFNQYISGINPDTGIYAYICSEDNCRGNYNDSFASLDVEYTDFEDAGDVRIHDRHNSLIVRI